MQNTGKAPCSTDTSLSLSFQGPAQAVSCDVSALHHCKAYCHHMHVQWCNFKQFIPNLSSFFFAPSHSVLPAETFVCNHNYMCTVNWTLLALFLWCPTDSEIFYSINFLLRKFKFKCYHWKCIWRFQCTVHKVRVYIELKTEPCIIQKKNEKGLLHSEKHIIFHMSSLQFCIPHLFSCSFRIVHCTHYWRCEPIIAKLIPLPTDTKYSSLYFVKYSSCRNMFQIEFVDLLLYHTLIFNIIIFQKICLRF